ncbi:hypothetical protein C2S51_002161 [Perilla frutescens var. frutescens]|nr:hypothetical protein C2S51_002161 [Perilla frutescens var. frutescens]
MAIERVIIAVIISSTLVAMVSATSGTSTFYTTYVPSACYGYADQGIMIAAAPRNLFYLSNGGRACGQMYRIRCTGGTNSVPNPCRAGDVVVKIVDLCPGCADNQIDLSQQAFSKIGNPDAGKIRIDFTR